MTPLLGYFETHETVHPNNSTYDVHEICFLVILNSSVKQAMEKLDEIWLSWKTEKESYS